MKCYFEKYKIQYFFKNKLSIANWYLVLSQKYTMKIKLTSNEMYIYIFKSYISTGTQILFPS